MIYFNNKPQLALTSSSLSNWLKALASDFKVSISTLQYNFVDENTLLQMNQKYLQHDTHTDIITFSYGSPVVVDAEIYISIDRMLENAIINKQTTENEFLRLISHGFLHCVGFNDHTDEEKANMREQENRCIEMFHVKQRKHV